MKMIRIFWSLLIVAVGGIATTVSTKAATNTYISKLPVQLVDKKETTLGRIQQGKPLYIKFWASWCVSCMKEMPKLVDDFKKHGDKVQFLTINVGIEDTEADVRNVYREFGLTGIPAAIDKEGKLGQALGFIGTPYHLLFEQNWKLLYKGHRADEHLAKAFSSLDSGPLKTQSNNPASIAPIKGAELAFSLPENGLVFYTIAWCSWYMQDMNAALAQSCDRSSRNIAQLEKEMPNLKILIALSPMWTDENEVQKYRENYALSSPILLDENNALSQKYGLRNTGIALVFKEGKLVHKVLDTGNYEQLKRLVF